MKIKVGVIFGGESVEHEVSIISAVQAMANLDQEKYDIVPIYISKEKEWYTGRALLNIENYQDLASIKSYTKNVVLYAKNNHFVLQTKGLFKRVIDEIDLAFPIVHGANIEDGTIQGYLDLVGVPYVGSNIYASVVGQDKIFMKQIFRAANLPITDYVWFFDIEFKENANAILKKIDTLKLPVLVKPATLGSSIGITKVSKKEELTTAIEEAMQYDTKIIVEEAVANLIEVNCSVLGNYEFQQTSEIEEVRAKDAILSYNDKYIGNGKKGGKSKGMVSTNRVIPAKIDDKLRKEVMSTAKAVFRVLNSAGVCRVDLLIDEKTKKVYVNEINTIPGSLSFYLWEPVGKTYSMLLDDLISLAIKSYKNRSKRTYSFDTNILSNFEGLKGNKGKLKH